MTRTSTRWTAFSLLAVLSAAVLSPPATADSRQTNKNNWRNLGYAGAAAAGYGLLKHDRTTTILGAAAGGYGAYRYEKDRHSQSQARDNWKRRYFYRRNYSRYNYSNQYATHRYYRHAPRGHAYGYYRHHR